MEGQVRPGLGQAARGDAGAADQAGRRAAGHEARAEAAGDQGLGHALGRREAPVRAPGRGVRRLPRVHRPRDRPHARRPSRRSGEADNTLVFYIAGDNGTSGEGGENGMFNEYTYFNGVQEKVAGHAEAHRQVGRARDLSAHGGRLGGGPQRAVRLDEAGARRTSAARATAWWCSWPKGIKAKNEIRTQFGHVIDVAPTDPAGGRPAGAQGRSTARRRSRWKARASCYSFDDAKAKERHTTQYFEIAGNRAIYHDGWFARTIHRAPWEAKPRHPLQDDVWELYDVRSDFSLANDLAAKQPEEARGDAGAVPEGSREVPRAADRRPRVRAARRRRWSAAPT